jgi:Mn2+/Fe2+ NRAMP family transporter
MDPTKIKARYLLGVILAAVVTAAALRHVLHVEAGFSRKEILVGALIAATIGTFLTVVFYRQRQGP